MKQQKQASSPTTILTEFPEPPKFPVLRTIGGETDRMAIMQYQRDHEQWYFDFRTGVLNRLQSLATALDTHTSQIAALQTAQSNATLKSG